MDSIYVNFHKIPNNIYKLGLSSIELVVLNYLLSLSSNETVHPSKSTIGSNTSLSKRTVDKAINSLVESGYLEYEEGFIENNNNFCNQYRVILENIDPDCIKKSQKQIDRENQNESECMEMIRNKIDRKDEFEND